MEIEDLTIEDIPDLTDKQLDRIAAEWLGEIYGKSFIDYWVGEGFIWESGGEVWPRYAEQWQHCGRLLERLPLNHNELADYYGVSVEQAYIVFVEKLRHVPKKEIVFFACHCAIEGIEPEVSDDN